ncbi:hypothetical protein RCL_jg1250.t1 [Rhizophagus clarus]|uniref:Uncharacterized protein n=1 Tax=Rhizophagus clarus TaxID=94130 RepID=A0A8H3KZ31_9GLOM|nr:hypothetical protein RCL_jg1250.t1 [Rhizophagus clarus]
MSRANMFSTEFKFLEEICVGVAFFFQQFFFRRFGTYSRITCTFIFPILRFPCSRSKSEFSCSLIISLINDIAF